MPTPDQLAQETRTSFPIGCRVKLNQAAREGFKSRHINRLGTVTGYAWGGFADYGFNSLVCLKIQWDGNKRPASGPYRNYVERVMNDA